MRLKQICIALIGLTTPLWGLTAAAANLSAIHQLALAHDSEYAAAQQARQAGIEALPQARAQLRPAISLTGSLSHTQTDPSPGARNDFDAHSYGVRLTQPLFRMQNLQAYEQGKLAALLADQRLALASQELILRVAQAYFDVLLAQDNLAAAQAQKDALAQQLAQARKSFEVGVATIVDTHEAQARFDVARAQEIAAHNDLEVRRSALEKLIGGAAPTLDSLRPGVQMALPAPNDMAAWVKQAEDANLAVLAAQTALESARREVRRQAGGHYPTLDLVASYSARSANNASAASPDAATGVLGLELNWPLYQGGGTRSRVRQAIANQEKARFELDTARRDGTLRARQAFLGVVSGEARVRALEAALVSGESQLRSTKLGLEVGVRTRVDVLNAQQQVYATQRDLAAARYQTLIAGLQLEAAAGNLDLDDLKALDALLQRR